ncbi:MAG: gliding motility-associated ABC transporter substrate-binding protein GldG [Cyclobacteriaceae bacterium]|nr:gliding motility-associated ABC transporter substrate-binding protein GldG [Cyclobacteriaceae bacterium]
MVILDSRKLQDFLILGIGILVIINLNMLFARHTFRLDLTEEKRYTISDASIELLESLSDVVYVDVYLEGDFPPGFERLQRSVRQTLEGFRVYAGDNIQYRYVDPQKIRGERGQQDLIRYLGEKGIQPTNLFASEDGKRTEKLIFPGAVMSYGGEEKGVMLLKGNKAAGSQERLNQSVEGVEFELISTIEQLVNVDRKRIAMIHGHGELDSIDIASIRQTILERYDLFHVYLPTKSSLEEYDGILIAKPLRPFSETDLYKIDQFIMKGGKAIFLMDMLEVNSDSISSEGSIGYPVNTNLEGLLFKYGTRINKDYLLDLNSGGFPVVVGNMGENPQIQMMPWPFYPIITNYTDHPVVRNLDAVYLRFTSSIDTVGVKGITKIPLMFTSPYTKTAGTPVKVSLNDLRKQMSPEIFNEGSQPVAYLLTGSFPSLFKGRFIPDGADGQNFISDSQPTSVIVCADGDIIRNEINEKAGVPYDLGYDPYLQAEFANAGFILNALAFLMDEDGVILSRNREVTIRPLDKVRVENEKVKWQMINLVIPIILVIMFGIIRYYWRKQKYSR